VFYGSYLLEKCSNIGCTSRPAIDTDFLIDLHRRSYSDRNIVIMLY